MHLRLSLGSVILVLVSLVIIGILVEGVSSKIADAGNISPHDIYAHQPETILNTSDVTSGTFGIPRTQSGTPAFTIKDVEQYIKTHPFPAGPTLSGKPLAVRSVEFISSGAASKRLQGESIGIPNNSLVCYVQLVGAYNPMFVSVPPGSHFTTANSAIEVFDATSGSLLVLSVPASSLQKN